MLAAAAKLKRESLMQEICNVLRQWPELERTVFSHAHYRGESPEVISRSLQLDVEEVTAILKECDRRLHGSLRNFRKNSGEKPSSLRVETVCPTAWEQDFKEAHPLASSAGKTLDSTRIAV